MNKVSHVTSLPQLSTAALDQFRTISRTLSPIRHGVLFRSSPDMNKVPDLWRGKQRESEDGEPADDDHGGHRTCGDLEFLFPGVAPHTDTPGVGRQSWQEAFWTFHTQN